MPTLWEKFQIWRLRPGVDFAARLAEQQAWKHPNAQFLGPEQNLLQFSVSLRDRMLRADEGELAGLYLDAVQSRAKIAEPLNAR